MLQVLSACRQLTWLDARCNRLCHVDAIASLPLLRALWLGGNSLHRLWGGRVGPSSVQAPFLPHLQLLHLQGNQDLLSVHQLTACWRLTSLHLQGAAVQAPQLLGALRTLRRLRVLRLPAGLNTQACLTALRVCNKYYVINNNKNNNNNDNTF